MRAVAVLVVLVAGAASAGVAIWWLTSDLLAAAERGGTTLDEAIGLAALLGCWLCVGWFVLAVMCSAAAATPGAVGRCGASAADLLAPWTLRKIVVAALGLTVVTGPAAGASGPTHVGAVPAATPASAGERVLPTQHRADLPPLDRPADVVVTVRHGDCLWSIAADHLGQQPTAAAIAAAWPQWYAVNRAVVGDDPDLIQPGQRLVAPG